MKRLLLLTLILMFMLAGCTVPQSNGHYTAEFPYEPLQYMVFLKKEIQGIENQVTTAMSHAVLVERGDYSAEQAAASAENSLLNIKAARMSIDVMRPPVKYIDTRAFALDIISTIEKDMDEFITELTKANPSGERMLEIKKSLHGNSISLAGLVNAYWV